MTPPSTPAPWTPNDLRAFRNSLGLTQSQLAKRLGLSRFRLIDLERGSDRATGAPTQLSRVIWLACLALAAGLDRQPPETSTPEDDRK
jgi:DNA-binding XRE family transcriptional regulator